VRGTLFELCDRPLAICGLSQRLTSTRRCCGQRQLYHWHMHNTLHPSNTRVCSRPSAVHLQHLWEPPAACETRFPALVYNALSANQHAQHYNCRWLSTANLHTQQLPDNTWSHHVMWAASATQINTGTARPHQLLVSSYRGCQGLSAGRCAQLSLSHANPGADSTTCSAQECRETGEVFSALQ
jgi:hypothetical protein